MSWSEGNLDITMMISDLISLLLVSDGKKLATAAAQLKIFNCSNKKKIEKFSGHPVSFICFFPSFYML